MKFDMIARAALILAFQPGAALADSTAATAPAPQAAVFIAKGDFQKVLDARVTGKGMGAVAAVRAGDDRIAVDVLRRDSPDDAPVFHSVVTEIYSILEGGGDFATGGTLVDPRPMMTNGKPTNPASIGPSMKSEKVTGGSIRHVAAGDVVMIPQGVVHGFTRLDGHVTYMVVRVNPDYEKGR